MNRLVVTACAVVMGAIVSGGTVVAQQASAIIPQELGLAALGPDGRFYATDCPGAAVFRLDPDGPVVVAGTGVAGYAGDGGSATEARLSCPIALAFDARGMFIVDHANNRIRLVDPSGRISTFAGNGPTGFGQAVLAGDGGPATEARFQEPTAIAIDPHGVIYISDRDNNAVRRIDEAGIITTIAGGGGRDGYGGDGGLAVDASLDDPAGIAFDASGGVLFADSNNDRIRRVDPAGLITTVAGSGASGFSGDEGSATLAALGDPESIAIDSVGNLYIADVENYRIRRVTPYGTITTFAGTGSARVTGDGGPATQAALGGPGMVLMGPDDVLTFWSYVAGCLRSIGPDGIIHTDWCL